MQKINKFQWGKHIVNSPLKFIFNKDNKNTKIYLKYG